MCQWKRLLKNIFRAACVTDEVEDDDDDGDDDDIIYFQRDNNKEYASYIQPASVAHRAANVVRATSRFNTRSASRVSSSSVSASSSISSSSSSSALSSRKTIRDYYIFQQDNACPYTAKSTQQCLINNHIRTVQWSSKSPDINPAEYVWAVTTPKVRQIMSGFEHPTRNRWAKKTNTQGIEFICELTSPYLFSS